jgi:anion-transporting  ArsA/GET3 family ATPase
MSGAKHSQQDEQDPDETAIPAGRPQKDTARLGFRSSASLTDTGGHRLPTAPVFDVDATLRSARIIVCCGSGGVGKTTSAAALALRAAELGRHVVVLTIDPARRLAQSMGLTELDNTPRPVPGVSAATTASGGSLDAMMLDMKRTFDEIVVAHSTPDKAEQIMSNPFYQSLSSSFSGTQEYMAMEKLGQLKADGTWDLVVVDTPPTRSALDFLDAPQNLGRFLDGRLLRLLLAPAKAGGRAYMKMLSVSVMTVARVFTKVIGAQVLQDVSNFVAALETMFGGFRQRAEETYRLLGAPGTAFVVVAPPEGAALREASYFVDRLNEERMPLAGLIVNRVHRTAAPGLTQQRSLAAAETLEERGESPTVAAILRVHAERTALATREQRLRGRFTSAHPEVPQVEVSALAGDVHDLDGLRGIGEELSSGLAATAPTADDLAS